MDFAQSSLICSLHPLPSSSLVLRYIEPSNGVAHVDDDEGSVNVCIPPTSLLPTSDMFKSCMQSLCSKFMIVPPHALRRLQHTIRTLKHHVEDK
ncbi:hypothetical protein D9613_012825 [Agrocybe pediades]|uniref:Uncharacterized protein n=1 Tax=Agrocybe pediades TaxID=84607 RepID=A0A8H4R3R1_9AGAR|nr:hypothetical protein D9613_012825 [Agrocybe pediades]